MKEKAAGITDYLGTGPAEAQTAKQLARFLGLPFRSVTRAIEAARRSGVPICANCDTEAPGYYIAADPEQLQNYCNRLKRREHEIRKTRRALERTCRVFKT